MKRVALFTLWLLVGLFVWQSAIAQSDDKPKKKPSWSPAMPERQATPDMNKPDLALDKPEMDIESDHFEMEPMDEISIQTEFTPQIEPVGIGKLPTSPESVVPEVELVKPVSTPVTGEYDWEVLQKVPVKVPKTLYFSYKAVPLRVSIDPSGHVVKVQRISPRTSDALLNYATKALKKWQFRPPSDYGVDEVIARDLMVDLQSRT